MVSLSIVSVSVSLAFEVAVILSHYVQFDSVTISDLSLSSNEINPITLFSPSMDTLSGSLSSFTFLLHPQSSIELGTVSESNCSLSNSLYRLHASLRTHLISLFLLHFLNPLTSLLTSPYLLHSLPLLKEVAKL